MDLVPYRTPANHCPLEEYLESLDVKPKKKVVRALDRLEKEGFALLRTDDIFSKVADDIYELRAPYNKMQHRVMCGWFQSKMYLTDAFAKKDRKLKQVDIQRSQDRLKEIKKYGKHKLEKFEGEIA